MEEEKYKIEVEYRSDFQILISQIKKFLLKIIKPIIGVAIFILALYVGFYIILFFIVFFFILYIYNKIRESL